MALRVIRYEETPNPNAIKAVLDRSSGDPLPAPLATRSFRSAQEAAADPLAAQFLAVRGVSAILLGAGWLTVNKTPEADWRSIKVAVEGILASVP